MTRSLRTDVGKADFCEIFAEGVDLSVSVTSFAISSEKVKGKRVV